MRFLPLHEDQNVNSVVSVRRNSLPKAGTYWKGSVVRNRLASPKPDENPTDPWESIEVTWENLDQVEGEVRSESRK